MSPDALPATASPATPPTVSPGRTHACRARRTLGAGIMPNNRGTMIGWIGDSQSIKPGNRMPNYDMLPAEDTTAIAACLETRNDVGERVRHQPLRPLSRPGPAPREEVKELERIWCAPRAGNISPQSTQLHRFLLHRRGVRLSSLRRGALALGMRVQLPRRCRNSCPQNLQPVLHDARHGDDVPLRRASGGGDGHPAAAADAGGARSAFRACRPMPFGLSGRRGRLLLLLVRRPRPRWRLVHVSAADQPRLFARDQHRLLAARHRLYRDFAIAGAIEIIVGVLRTRAPGMSLDKMPIFAWAMLVFAVMIVIAFPRSSSARCCWRWSAPSTGRSSTRRAAATRCCGSICSGSSATPRCTSSSCPAAGMMSMMVATVAQTPGRGHRLVVVAMVATGFISFGVWAHHMFSVGMPGMSTGFFSAASMAVSVPAGIQVFAWIATLAAGKIRWSTPAFVRRRQHPHLHRRRTQRRDGGDGAVRLAGARHVLHRRPSSATC